MASDERQTGGEKQTIAELRARLADYALAVDLLSRMAQEVEESAVVDDILRLFVELCGPAFISFTPVVDGKLGEPVTVGERPEGEVDLGIRTVPAEGPALTESRRGFALRLDHGDEVLGVIVAEDLRFPEHREHYLEIAGEVAELLALGISNARARDMLVRSSATDDLTQLANRRSCFERLEVEVLRIRRLKATLAVVMLDLDGFKPVNDQHGHHAGDAVLRQTAERIQACIRPYDILARLGGDEFLLVAPGSELEAAQKLAERLRRCIADRVFEVDGVAISLTISCGVTVAAAEEPSVETLIARADKALYEAKRAGRDRVTVVPAKDDAGQP